MLNKNQNYRPPPVQQYNPSVFPQSGNLKDQPLSRWKDLQKIEQDNEKIRKSFDESRQQLRQQIEKTRQCLEKK